MSNTIEFESVPTVRIGKWHFPAAPRSALIALDEIKEEMAELEERRKALSLFMESLIPISDGESSSTLDGVTRSRVTRNNVSWKTACEKVVETFVAVPQKEACQKIIDGCVSTTSYSTFKVAREEHEAHANTENT